ncbi:CYFA0S19e01376g1_1 [Cyberlindnera fabianii]|uniref:Peptidase M20 domain-containing protein 2 n=1 Tax=Cyberlindnera fabianii TaxID=36022 RepID=A0A061B6V6_CYBFA|nr:CYFA0S19e01376g1_1 [Cyberlindnera fabianii]
MTSFMEKQPGWSVTKSACGMETAFIADFTHNATDSTPVISYNAEYDALPGIGHACGHNLISVCSLTAAVATATAMIEFDIPGTVKIFGTPAEEYGGGKIKFIDAGAYEGCDVSLIGHGSYGQTHASARTTAIKNFNVEFFGREAHAAASPWEGINALDAMNIMYASVAALRQQLMPSDIVQCCVNQGGTVPNIITGYTSAAFAVRAPTLGRMNELYDKISNCVKAGALATGCKFKISILDTYANHIPNQVLAARFRDNMIRVFGEKMLSIDEDYRTGITGASTDQGNVSWVVPSLHPMFNVDNPYGAGPHTKDFAKAAGTREAHDSAVLTGMGLSVVGVELLLNPDLLAEVKAKFDDDINKAKGELTSSVNSIKSFADLEVTE